MITEKLRKAHDDVLAGQGAAFNTHAKSTFPNYIPNAYKHRPRSCTNCHRDPSGAYIDPFGQDDVEGRRPDWSALYYLDSDGDGQTNGQELGDPYLGPGRAGTSNRYLQPNR